MTDIVDFKHNHLKDATLVYTGSEDRVIKFKVIFDSDEELISKN